MMDPKLGYIDEKSCLFMLCDVQEKFAPAIKHFSEIVENISKVLEVGRVMEIPLVASEQYRRGLGGTVPQLNLSHSITAVVDKTQFSMCVPELVSVLDNMRPSVAVIMGLEAHVCVEQTAMDLLQRGICVHVLADCVSSRSQEDRHLAFQRMRQLGCFISTSESVIFKLIKDKENPHFSRVRQLVKKTSCYTGLDHV